MVESLALIGGSVILYTLSIFGGFGLLYFIDSAILYYGHHQRMIKRSPR